MKAYDHVVPAVFLSRPNRFVARVLLDGKEETVHVKNTGRLRELLFEGATVYLSRANRPDRKTKHDLVAVEKVYDDGRRSVVNLDSQLPNAVALEYLRGAKIFSEDAVFKREVTHGDSRFDLCVEEKGKCTYIEVKGVTLETEGVAMFPDAPTERGVKHLYGLSDCVAEGHGALMLFVIQMKGVRAFRPHDLRHPAFGEALRRAKRMGVKIMAVDCRVTPDSVTADKQIPVEL